MAHAPPTEPMQFRAWLMAFVDKSSKCNCSSSELPGSTTYTKSSTNMARPPTGAEGSSLRLLTRQSLFGCERQ